MATATGRPAGHGRPGVANQRSQEAVALERLQPLDAQFIEAENEDGHTSLAICSISIFEGPAPSYDEFLTAVAARLDLAPIYRRKLRNVPLRLGPPVWVEAQHFDLRYHVRQTAVPAPGGDEQLSRLVARVMSQRLDRDYPLWEYWLVEGLNGGRWGLIAKVHHALVDGISGLDLFQVLFDLSPEPSREPADAWKAMVAGDSHGKREPSALELAGRAAVDLGLLPLRTARALGGAAAHPARSLRRASDTAAATGKLAASSRPAVESSLSGPIGSQRRYAWALASLDEIKAIGRQFGGTVNDVVLAAITSGFRALLLDRGERPESHMVPSLVPVSVRNPGDAGVYENQFSVVIADLPVHVEDPVQQLASVRKQLAAVKTGNKATVAPALVRIGHYMPYPLTSRVVRLFYRMPQREVVTVTTNVPGPRQPLYALGRKLIDLVPYVPIAAWLRTGICIFSYCDKVTFGITGDYDSTPDLDVLAAGIENGVQDLLIAAAS
jgi:WS/DGAT/MGAT family acyltransferase